MGLLSIFFLAIGNFKPSIIFSLALFLLILFVFVFRKHISIKDERFSLWIIPVVLISLYFRLPAWQYVMGGQDQGTYTNMAIQYLKSGKIFAVDEFRQTLTPEQQKLYDFKGNYLMPSIEKWNRPDSEYSMTLYPLHPLFMALASSIFSPDQMSLSLTLFSIISILYLYLITLEITKSKGAAIVVAGLMAINPLHVFFSRFPVTEITALAFNGMGFYYLLRFMKNYRNGRFAYLYGFLSFLSFTCFMYTRMSFLLYLPFVYLVTATVFAISKSLKNAVPFFLYQLCLVLSFIISYLFYYFKNRPLFDAVFGSTVEKFLYLANKFTKIPDLFLEVIIIFLLISFPILVRYLMTKTESRKNTFVFQRVYALLCVVLMSIIFIQSFILYSNLAGYRSKSFSRYGIEGLGFNTIKHLKTFSALSYVSPLLFLVFLLYPIFLLSNNKKTSWGKNTPVYLLIIHSFVMTYFFINTLFGGAMRYAYYDVRYNLSEIVPYITVCAVAILYQYFGKRVFATVAVISALYLLTFSCILLKGNEGISTGFYSNILSKVSRNDIMLLYNDRSVYSSPLSLYEGNFNSYVYGPLKYFYDRKTIVLEDNMPYDYIILKSILSKAQNTFLLSNVPLDKIADMKVKLISQDQADYSYYNNPLGCSPHTYEFLKLESWQTPINFGALKCITPPNTYFTRSRIYYWYEVLTS